MAIRRSSPASTAMPASEHPPHAARPTAAPSSRRFLRPGRLLAALVAVLAVAGCGPRPSAGPSSGPSLPVYSGIRTAFGPYGDAVVSKAFAVAKCESGWVPTAGAGSYYQGLFQLGRHVSAINNYGGDFLNAYQNAAAARDLWLSRGMSWSAWPNCG